MIYDNKCILLVSRHLFQLQATNSRADRMKIALLFSLSDRMDRMDTLNRLWMCFLLSKVEKLQVFLKNKQKNCILQLFLIFCLFYNIATRMECILSLSFLHFSHKDKINSS